MIGNIFLSLVYKIEPENPSQPRGERLTILDSSDHEIEALFFERKNARGIVIFCHESGATKDSWEKYAACLPELGWQVLSVDYSSPSVESAQNSLAQWPLAEEVERLCVAIRWSKRVSPCVVLFGVSKGADIALAASEKDASVKAIITDGLFSMKEVFRDYIRKWAPVLVKPNFFGEKYPWWIVDLFARLGFKRCQTEARKSFVDVEYFLRRPHPPLLMIHGEEDDYVSVTHQHYLEKISRKTKSTRPWVVPKARHNQAVLLARSDYEKKISEFLGEIR